MERKNNPNFDYEHIYQLFVGKENLLSKCESRKRIYALKDYLNIDLSKKRQASDVTRLLSLSDLHIPFQLSNLLEVIYQFKNKIDVLVLNGDILDNQSISSFNKLYRVPIIEEVNQARKILYQLIFLLNPKTVVYVHGNHDGARLSRYLSKRLDSDILRLMPNNFIDLIIDTGFYINDYQNKTKEYKEGLKDIFIDDDINLVNASNWYYQIGKTIFAHPTRFSSVPMKTAKLANEYFKCKELDYDCVVLGHTHKVGYIKDCNKHLFEQGCLCSELDYVKSGNMIKPHQNGFVYLEQDKRGNLIYANSKLIIL